MAEGAIVLGGKQYTWSSPRIRDLEEFESIVGPILNVENINSMRGRAYLTLLCLRQHHPDLSLGTIEDLDAGDASRFWGMISQAIPFWGTVALPNPSPGGSAADSSEPAPSNSTGPPASPGENASPTS
jgi:hypothetical protein